MLKKYNRSVQLHIQYDGSRYAGWQSQPNRDTIQSVLEGALTKIANEKVVLFASGRTDAGVHAKKQIVSFSTTKSKTPAQAFVDGTNTLLPSDIRVTYASDEKVEFHAIKSVSSKVYRYFFIYGAIENVFRRNYVWHIRFPFNVSNMKKAARTLVGKHDFSCFQTHGKETKTSIRTIHKMSIKQTKEKVYYLEIEADGFLRHMVRSVMGTLVDIGTGKIESKNLKNILQSKDRTKAGQTAPAHGLFLWDVKLKRE